MGTLSKVDTVRPFALATRALALCFGVAAACALRLYPQQHHLLLPLLAAYAAIVLWRPASWLLLLPALLPVLDLAPWTGWFFFEEIDVLLLITAALGYWRLAGLAPVCRLPAWAPPALALLTLVYLVGTWKGLQPLTAPDLNAFNNYLSPWNSMRIAKSWFWAMILLPLLLRYPRQSLLPGMLAGLALVALAALRERVIFPGLSNLASDYRITAPFSAMHTGGAALDGYLALTMPLVALWLVGRQPRWKSAAAVLLLMLAGHAGLATFSRALYGAMAISGLILAGALLLPALARHLRQRAHLALASLFALLVLWTLFQVFASSGYRGLAAATPMLAAACLLCGAPRLRSTLVPGLPCALAIEGLLVLLLTSLPPLGDGLLKPPYLLFVLAALGFGAGVLAQNVAAAVIAFFCIVCNTLWIAWHWGGAGALPPMLLAVALALLLIGATSDKTFAAPKKSAWHPSRASWSSAAAGLALLVLVIPVSASYYAGERFSTTGGDWQRRLRHWSQALAMMDDDAATRWTGMGIGRFPATYYWRNRVGEAPGRLVYVDEPGNRYLRLVAPGYAQGYGELLRLLQQVTLVPQQPYLLGIDVRRSASLPILQLRLCQRQLLYPQNCVAAPLRLLPPDGQWHRYQVALDSAVLGSGHWPLRAPVQLELAAAGAGTSAATLDIDNLSLLDVTGQRELLANGNFSEANNYWFFSSDRHHLPWHVKSFALNLYVDMGWLGLLAMAAVLLPAMASLLRQACANDRPERLAPIYLASLSGFLAVGLFDSLLDVPRVGLLFFLVLLTSMLISVTAARNGAP